jgi:hypothetical protein
MYEPPDWLARAGLRNRIATFTEALNAFDAHACRIQRAQRGK